MEFRAKRVAHEFVQTNSAIPAKVFPLLCPVREAEWVPGWQYRLIYSKTGVAEMGCVFVTPNSDGSETVWTVTEYDPANFQIAFAWVHPQVMTAQIEISLKQKGSDSTEARVRYTYTGLSPEGNAEIDRYDEEWFRHKMTSWEAAVNHYLRTGKRMDKAESE